MTDQELAARARDGDQDAFEQLVRDNEKRIYTLALRMTGSREDALDLAQDAFFQAWKALPTSSSSPRRRWSAQSAAGPWSGGWPPSRITTARC